VLGISVVVVGDRYDFVRRGRGDAADSDLVEAVEDGTVLGHCRRSTGIDHGVEIQIGRAPVGSVQFSPGEGEAGPKFDEREQEPLRRANLWVRAARERVDAAEIDGRMVPAKRPPKVDQSASSEEVRERAGRLRVDLSPGRIGDRREFACQMVH
jgi:hypothetical protein